jgi:hypothetical protein
MVQGQERRSDRTARMEQAELQYPPHHHERQPRPLSYGRQQLYGPGIPGPEMEHQLAAGEATARYPSLVMGPHKPTTPSPCWLTTLEAFNACDNLPCQTNGKDVSSDATSADD